MDFLTLHSRKQNYFLLLLSGIGSPPPSHHHHCCFVQKKPSSVFPRVLSIGGMRAVCSVAAAVADFLPALSWASSLPDVNHIFSHPSSVWPQNPHLPPAFVSFPLRCFLDTICNPAAVSCGIIALFSVCGAASWLVCVITGEWCSQSRPNQVVGPDCRGGSLLAGSASPLGHGMPAVECSNWCPHEQSFSELSSSACHSPEICSEVHATVLAAFVSTVR